MVKVIVIVIVIVIDGQVIDNSLLLLYYTILFSLNSVGLVVKHHVKGTYFEVIRL